MKVTGCKPHISTLNKRKCLLCQKGQLDIEVNLTTNSDGFARLRLKSVGLRSEKFSGSGQNLISSDLIGKPRIPTIHPTEHRKINSTTDSDGFVWLRQIGRSSVRKIFWQLSEPNTFRSDRKTLKSDRPSD